MSSKIFTVEGVLRDWFKIYGMKIKLMTKKD